jgi:hypothetical protein
MLISMPTCTSTIFGVFQAIALSFPNPSGTGPTIVKRLTRATRFAIHEVAQGAAQSRDCDAVQQEADALHRKTSQLQVPDSILQWQSVPALKRPQSAFAKRSSSA